MALARALVIQPKVLLLDEPVSALDEATREIICMELRHIQRETGTTTVHVSHNFEETRIVADRVGILRDGQLTQIGTPDYVFSHPADAGVAKFLRVGSVLRGYAETDGEYTRITIGDKTLIKSDAAAFRFPREVEFVLPARDVLISIDYPNNQFENVLTGSVVRAFPRGMASYIAVEVEPSLILTVLVPTAFDTIAPGTKVHLTFPASAIHVFQ